MDKAKVLEQAIRKAIDTYEINPDGSIYNRRLKRWVNGSLDRKGYRYLSVYLAETGKQKKVKIHRLVARKYIPNPGNLPFINHKDGNPQNNHRDNLEWCTEQYNVIDGFSRGREVWNKGNISKERMLFLARKYPRQIFWYLATNDFALAKALWGEWEHVRNVQWEIVTKFGTTVAKTPIYENVILELWQYHLQQMVIADDPIAYLADNMPKDN